MIKIIFAFLFLAGLTCPVIAQTDRGWAQWSKKDAEKILTDSAWAQTQSETDTSEMFYTPTKGGTASIAQSGKTNVNDQQNINNNRADRGATNQAVTVNYRIRFLSAKPIREAISRMIMLNRDTPVEGLEATMQTFVDRDFGQYIVVAVTIDSTDARFSGPVGQAFGAATLNTLKNATYLERKDGKRLYLVDYRSPQSDGLGAKFVFPRLLGEDRFVSTESGTVRFYSEIDPKIKLNVKYKISAMIRGDKLEM